ncbi:MAG: YceI family protein [Puniceicoccaceae bacterium]
MKSSLTAIAALLVALAPAYSAVQTFQADPAHSSVTFKIRHFFTTVPGSFGELEAKIRYDGEDVSSSSAEATLSIASVDTNNDKRDNHLRDEDFFDVAEHPEIRFESTSWSKTGDDEFEVKGDLTMAGETKEVTLDVTLLGMKENTKGAMVSGWEAKTTLDRRDWGISYGQGIVGNEVNVEIFVQAPEAE